MNTQDFINFIPTFMDKLTKDKMSTNVIENSKWIIGCFKKYCESHEISEINMPVIQKFYETQYYIDIYNVTSSLQTTLRRPLLIFMEYYEYGSYLKTHQKSKRLSISSNYTSLFESFQVELVNNSNISKNSKERKLCCISNFINYLDSFGLKSIAELTQSQVHEYIIFLENDKKFATSTVRTTKTILREFFNWIYSNGFICFSGIQVFPIIKKDSRNVLLSTYTDEEISKILNIVNTDNKEGKFLYSILTLLSYLGLRAGDIINLKFNDINFATNTINLVQQKTGKLNTLPIIDEVKYPLLDYIENSRNASEDNEYIFITQHAPYTKYKQTSSIHRLITNAMNTASVNYQNKHHGPHAFRHSLATSMLNSNIPISSISQVLGHNNTKTTEIYATKNTDNLRMLCLEVPNG